MKRLLLLFSAAVLAFAADLTGTWNFNVETDMGSGSPIMTFKQDGNNLTGTYKGQLGEATLHGTVDGNKVEFSFEVSPTGDKFLVRYTGNVDGNTMKGTVDLAGQATGKFTATKK
jgi:hypothetical protein